MVLWYSVNSSRDINRTSSVYILPEVKPVNKPDPESNGFENVAVVDDTYSGCWCYLTLVKRLYIIMDICTRDFAECEWTMRCSVRIVTDAYLVELGDMFDSALQMSNNCSVLLDLVWYW